MKVQFHRTAAKRCFLAVAGLVLGGLWLEPAGRTIAADTPPANQAAAEPAKIDIEHAPAPLFDDPVWHGASDPFVIWMPGKGDGGSVVKGSGEWWMYYTQRRA